MLLKKLKPKTSGTRHQILINKTYLAKKNKIIKKNKKGIKFQAGRSTQTGHITSWHKGGHKKKIIYNLKENNLNAVFINLLNLYNPNKRSFVSFKYNFFKKKFELCSTTEYVCSGTLLENGIKTENFKHGYFLSLDKIPVGFQINSIANKNTKKIIYTRSAGTSSQILQKSKDFVKIKLASGKIITENIKNFAYIGSVSNKMANALKFGKAGKTRIIGKRPIVRGVAMNAVDHPHGGQTSGGRPSVSPWGKLTKGVPTKKK